MESKMNKNHLLAALANATIAINANKTFIVFFWAEIKSICYPISSIWRRSLSTILDLKRARRISPDLPECFLEMKILQILLINLKFRSQDKFLEYLFLRNFTVISRNIR